MFQGAAHATAWNYILVTDVGRLFGKSPALTPLLSLLAFFSVVIFQHEHGNKLLLQPYFSHEPRIIPFFYRLEIVTGVLNFPFWLFSRMYIIVETFIHLRHGQLGVYKTVERTDYKPRI